MLNIFNNIIQRRTKKYPFGNRKVNREIDPDQVILDSRNIPKFDTNQMEGRLERPITKVMLLIVLGIYILIAGTFVVQAFKLQIIRGLEYQSRSERNILRPVPIFAGRGVVYDRNDIMLAWNIPGDNIDSNLMKRKYATSTGLAHTLGYVQYPSKDKNGFYYQEDFLGIAGVEKIYNEKLKGTIGSRLIEVDASGKVISENIVKPQLQGENIKLSIDSRVQSAIYNNLRDIATRVGFTGGAGVILDVNNGEILAMTSYPEYNSQIMSDKKDQASIKSMLNNPGLLFLNRAVDGLYVPGSIVKPYVALGALSENIIDPSTVIVTTGSISIPNPYDDKKFTLFRDWKNHGAIDMRHAIAVSSDAYFYIVGGGYKDQKGLGISNIDKYLKMFGFGVMTTDGSKSIFMNKTGTIPTPEWKKRIFNENWYIGDTYHSAIGQYGFQVTPLQIARAVAAIANKGKLISPTIIKGDLPHIESTVSISEKDFKIIHEGMRLSTEVGTSVALNVPYVKIAGKSGTAELGLSKANVNSWITGFWPYENPKYAFVLLLEHGSAHNLIGAAAAMRQTLDWMNVNTSEYFR